MKTELCAFTFRDAKTGGIIEVITELDVLHAKNIALDILNETCKDSHELELIELELANG